MKKILIIALLIVFLCPIALFAVNGQKLYDHNSDEYYMTKLLTSYAGVAHPFAVSPLTANELVLALDRIDENQLPQDVRALYDSLYSKLSQEQSKTFEYDITGYIAPETYLTPEISWLKSEKKYGVSEFFIPYHDQLSFFNVEAQLGFGDNAYLEGAIDIKNKPSNNGVSPFSFEWLLSFEDGEFACLQKNGAVLYEPHIPNKARGSFGNTWFNFLIGRSRHSFGNGFTGNLVVGDNFPYQEMMKVDFFTKNFAYNLSITHFDTQIANADSPNIEVFDHPRFGGMHQNRVIHRFDFVAGNKVNIALNLGTLYHTDSAFDIRFLTPFMISHDYFNYNEKVENRDPFDEANNIMSGELTWAFLPKWSLGAQIVVDQFRLAFEKEGLTPNGLGGLLNLSYTDFIKDASIQFRTEIAYTTPYLYCNSKKNADGKWDYNYDFMVGYFRDYWMEQNISYAGYAYGPDCFLLNLGFDYHNFSKAVKYRGELYYIAHGERGISKPTFEGFKDGEFMLTGIVSHTLKFNNYINYMIKKDVLEFNCGLSLGYTWNYNNKNSNLFIPQAYLGLVWKY